MFCENCNCDGCMKEKRKRNPILVIGYGARADIGILAMERLSKAFNVVNAESIKISALIEAIDYSPEAKDPRKEPFYRKFERGHRRYLKR